MKEFAYIHDEGATPAALQTVPLFKTFSEEQLDDVLNSSNLLQCDVGDAIIQEGTIDSRIYILLSGTLEVRVGGKHVANIARSGEVFGELALVNPRQAPGLRGRRHQGRVPGRGPEVSAGHPSAPMRTPPSTPRCMSSWPV